MFFFEQLSCPRPHLLGGVSSPQSAQVWTQVILLWQVVRRSLLASRFVPMPTSLLSLPRVTQTFYLLTSQEGRARHREVCVERRLHSRNFFQYLVMIALFYYQSSRLTSHGV